MIASRARGTQAGGTSGWPMRPAAVSVSWNPDVPDDLILETRQLTKEFRGFVAVDDVTLRVPRNTIHGMIGPNGAGKTTVFNVITKLLAPSRGQILYDGRDVTRERPAQLARSGMVRSFQISAVFPNLTVLENVRLPLQREAGVAFHFWRSERWLRRLDDRAAQLLDTVGLSDVLAVPAGELPYGKKRALEIATTLALEPKLLLLDEPMAGLAQDDIARVSALIRTAGATRSVLMVEHNMGVIADLCDRITVLQYGRILAEGTYAEVSANPDVIQAYMGPADA
jgi:branched-chain amino acid transport system ATP-binding protein